MIVTRSSAHCTARLIINHIQHLFCSLKSPVSISAIVSVLLSAGQGIVGEGREIAQ